MSKNAKTPPSTIAQNKKARFDYHIEEKYEAGLMLLGWEVKALRLGKAQISDSYVIIKGGEAWLLGSVIQALPTTSTHVTAEPDRTRKLLLHRHELDKLIGVTERKGYTLVPLAIYWKKGRAKIEIGSAKGKKDHDKRATQKDRDWQREKQRVLKVSS